MAIHSHDPLWPCLHMQARLNLMAPCSQFGGGPGSRSSPATAGPPSQQRHQHQQGSQSVRSSGITPRRLSNAITTQGGDGSGTLSARQVSGCGVKKED
eukprot:1157271-Pelagomonas_calceolata.AAC.2